jgi:DNA primase
MPPEKTLTYNQGKATLVEIISKYVQLEASRKVLKGRCPFHQDNLTSLMVSPEKNIFKCFGCGREGGYDEFATAVKEMHIKEMIQSDQISAA